MLTDPRAIYVHVHPKNTSYHGLHEFNLGPECWCEPVVAFRMDPRNPKQSIYLVIHNHDLIDVTLVGKVQLLEPPRDKGPESPPSGPRPAPFGPRPD
jgi:hypothetical protein